MTKRKQTVAERTAAFADLFPKHAYHDAFLDAAITLRAEDLAQAALTQADAALLEAARIHEVAKAEFRDALHAVFHSPTDGKFIFIWASAAQARELIHYTQQAWSAANGKYGEYEPLHFEAAADTSKHH